MENTNNSINRVSIIGAGTMGHGIAYSSIISGYSTTITDTSDDRLDGAIHHIEAALTKGVSRNKLTQEDAQTARNRLQTDSNFESAVKDADLVIEAVPENLQLKQDIFRRLSEICKPESILASNTSSLSITAIASASKDPTRVIGMHFFNPVPAMKLVELVTGEETSNPTIGVARDFAESLGKTPIIVKDSPGFASSRLGVILGLEAMRMLEQGVATAEDIDKAMELGYNHPIGPLKLTDLVGLDIRLAIADHLHATFGQDTYAAPQILRDYVKAGKLGKKSGEGFYRW